mgnify:CR=1
MTRIELNYIKTEEKQKMKSDIKLFTIYAVINGIQQYFFLVKMKLPDLSILITIILSLLYILIYRKLQNKQH